jgi:hypothetical protein
MPLEASSQPTSDVPGTFASWPLCSGQGAWDRWFPWLIVVAVALFFGRVIGNGISPADDRDTIFLNPRISPTEHPPTFFGNDGASWYWRHGDMALYMPVTSSIWFLLAKLTWVQTPDENGFRLDARVFHVVSLLLHIGNTLLVYGLLRILLRVRQIRSFWPALVGALVYGLHPLQVETVAWTSGMKDLLYCGFSLGALLAYLRAIQPSEAESSGDAGRKRWCSYIGGIVAMEIGMLCKPSAMVVPLLAFIFDLLILRRRWKQIAISVIPYMIAAIPLMIVAKIEQPGMGVPSPPLWQRPVVAGASLAFYLGKLIAPVQLTYNYGWRPVQMLQKPWFWWIVGIPVVIGIVVFMLRRARPWLLVGALVGVAALLPVLGFNAFLFQFHSTVADHYMVLAMLGPAVAVAGVLSARGGEPKLATVGAMTAVVLILGSMSFLQLGHWHTEEAVLKQMLAVSPDTELAHNGLGQLYRSHGDLKSAEIEFAATQIDPFYLNGTENLAHVYAQDGQPKNAIAAYHQLLVIANRLSPELRPDYHDMPLKLAMEAIQAGHPRNVPVYLLEIARMWLAQHFEAWLGGPMVKYLPASHAVPIAPT